MSKNVGDDLAIFLDNYAKKKKKMSKKKNFWKKVWAIFNSIFSTILNHFRRSFELFWAKFVIGKDNLQHFEHFTTFFCAKLFKDFAKNVVPNTK